MKYKRIAIDLDGTLFEDEKNTEYLFQNNIDLKPMSDAAFATQWLKSIGFEILITTCRPDYHRKYLESLLKKNNIEFDDILYYTKPRVDLYVDDKGFRFVDWKTTVSWIDNQLQHNEKNCQEPDTYFEKILRKNKIKPIDSLLQHSKILDVGCGSGDVFNNVNTLLKIDGVEPDKNLRKKAEDLQIYENIYEKLEDIDVTKYDLVTLLGVLEHVDDVRTFLKLFLKCKKLYITVPNAKSYHRLVGQKMGLIKDIYALGKNDLEIGHKRYYDSALLSKDLNVLLDNDFVIKKFGTTSFKFLPNEQMKAFQDTICYHAEVAKDLGICGESSFFGAELYCLLERI